MVCPPRCRGCRVSDVDDLHDVYVFGRNIGCYCSLCEKALLNELQNNSDLRYRFFKQAQRLGCC